MAGVLETDPVRDVLDLCLWLVQQKFLCHGNSKVQQISIDGAPEEPVKQPSKILWSYVDQSGQFGYRQGAVIICFDFLYHWQDVFPIPGMVRQVMAAPVTGKAEEK